MKRKEHIKLKASAIKDRGFSKRDWADLILLVVFLILSAALIFAFIIAALRMVTEVV
jgi:hypothetical protein